MDNPEVLKVIGSFQIGLADIGRSLQRGFVQVYRWTRNRIWRRET